MCILIFLSLPNYVLDTLQLPNYVLDTLQAHFKHVHFYWIQTIYETIRKEYKQNYESHCITG